MNGTINQINLNGTLNNGLLIKGSLNSPKITGALKNAGNIKGFINAGLNIIGNIKSDVLSGVLTIGSSYQDYSGAYDVTPQTESQTLPTENKVLRQDVLIKKIPYFETSNDYGKTVYIGSEVN